MMEKGLTKVDLAESASKTIWRRLRDPEVITVAEIRKFAELRDLS
jgi:hypothetical protein